MTESKKDAEQQDEGQDTELYKGEYKKGGDAVPSPGGDEEERTHTLGQHQGTGKQEPRESRSGTASTNKPVEPASGGEQDKQPAGDGGGEQE